MIVASTRPNAAPESRSAMVPAPPPHAGPPAHERHGLREPCPASPPGRGHVIAGLGPDREATTGRIVLYAMLLVPALVLTALLIGALVDAIDPPPVGPLQVEMPWSPVPVLVIGTVLLHVVGAIGVLGVGIVQQARRRTLGEEAIQLLVTTAGVTGPGGIDIPWEEIRGVRVGALPVAHGADVVEVAGIWLLRNMGRSGRQGRHLAERAVTGSVRRRPPVVVLVDLVTPGGVVERARTDRQRRAVDVLGPSPHVRIELVDHPAERLGIVVRVLAEELGRRGLGLYQM